jgi:sugar/nucleoside kinase (ribokinase family)
VGTLNVDLSFIGLPRIPNEGEELYSSGFSIQLGGGTVNTMANLGRLGVPVKAGTFLGRDIFSDYARQELGKAGLDPVNLYKKDTGIPLAISVAALTPRDRTFISYIDSPEIGSRELDEIYRFAQGARVMQMQQDERTLDLFRTLKKEGTVLVLDVGWDEEASLAKYREVLELADYFTPNRMEALKLTGAATVQEAARVLSDFFDPALIKMDSQGCLLYEKGSFSLIGAIPEFQYVDSTGAGDAFLSGLMYGIYHGRTIGESILMGNIMGGKCVSAVGCLNGGINEAEFLDIFGRHTSPACPKTRLLLG